MPSAFAFGVRTAGKLGSAIHLFASSQMAASSSGPGNCHPLTPGSPNFPISGLETYYRGCFHMRVVDFVGVTRSSVSSKTSPASSETPARDSALPRSRSKAIPERDPACRQRASLAPECPLSSPLRGPLDLSQARDTHNSAFGQSPPLPI